MVNKALIVLIFAPVHEYLCRIYIPLLFINENHFQLYATSILILKLKWLYLVTFCIILISQFWRVEQMCLVMGIVKQGDNQFGRGFFKLIKKILTAALTVLKSKWSSILSQCLVCSGILTVFSPLRERSFILSENKSHLKSSKLEL